jgi:hypothetical protein
MKKTFNQFVSVSLLSLSICSVKLAVAGERGGNGGDGVVCPTETRVLDELEFDEKGLNYISDDRKPYRSQVSDVLYNLKQKMPDMASKIEVYAEELLADVDSLKKETRVLENYAYKVALFGKAELLDVNDSEHESVPKNCVVKQLARHNTKTIGFEKKYTFDLNLFNQLSQKSIASIVLHESIFRFLIENYSDNNAFYFEKKTYTSKNARHFHNLISSQELNTLSVSEFLNYLNQLKISYFKVNDDLVKFKNIDLSNRSIQISGSLSTERKEFLISDAERIIFSKQEDCIIWETNDYVYPTGNGDGTYSYSQGSSTVCSIRKGYSREASFAEDFPVRIKTLKLQGNDRLVRSKK